MKLLNLNFDLCELRKGLQNIDFSVKLSQNFNGKTSSKIENIPEEELLRDDLIIEGPLFIIKEKTSKNLGRIKLNNLSAVQSKAIRLEWAQFSTKLLTVLGLRQSAKAIANATYKTAFKQNEHSIAANMAYYLSRHYSLYDNNMAKGAKFWKLYEESCKSDSLTKKALFEYGAFLGRFRHGRVVSPEILDQINATISSLKQLGVSQRTCTYAFLLHQLQLYKLESQHEYPEMILVAEKGLEYFEKYFPNHIDEKLTFLSHIVSAHMSLGQYDLAIDLLERVEAFKNKGNAYQLSMLHLMRAALNLNDPDRALKIYKDANLATSKCTEVQQMRNMQLQFTYLLKGDFESFNLSSEAYNVNCKMAKNNVLVAIMTKGCLVQSQSTESYERMLTSWRQNFGNVPSRTSTFLSLLQLCQTYGFQSSEVQSKKKHLMRVVNQLPREEFESEIVNYALLWDIIDYNSKEITY